MNREIATLADQDALDRADKAAWREQEGWCTPREAADILASDKGPRFELVETEV